LKLALVLGSALALAAPAGAQDALYRSAMRFSATLDWVSGELVAELSLDLVAAGLRLPSGRAEAERAVERLAPVLAEPELLKITLDSYRSVGEGLAAGMIEQAAFHDYLEGGRRVRSAMSRDLRFYEARYAWSLGALAGLFAGHGRASEAPQSIGFTPSRPYSGIVVYLSGALPVRGERRDERPVPALLPKLWDERMNLIYEQSRLDPDMARAMLPVAYAFGVDDPAIERRAGADPLRIMATGVFGSLRTDPVLARDDALRILSEGANRELLRQGKLVFVFMD
jgi:hypothetical protein